MLSKLKHRMSKIVGSYIYICIEEASKGVMHSCFFIMQRYLCTRNKQRSTILVFLYCPQMLGKVGRGCKSMHTYIHTYIKEAKQSFQSVPNCIYRENKKMSHPFLFVYISIDNNVPTVQ